MHQPSSDFPNTRRLCALEINTSAALEHRWVKTTASHVNMCSHLAQNQIWASRIARSHLLHGHGFEVSKANRVDGPGGGGRTFRLFSQCFLGIIRIVTRLLPITQEGA